MNSQNGINHAWLKNSYCRSKQRISESYQASNWTSYGARIEFGLPRHLFKAMQRRASEVHALDGFPDHLDAHPAAVWAVMLSCISTFLHCEASSFEVKLLIASIGALATYFVLHPFAPSHSRTSASYVKGKIRDTIESKRLTECQLNTSRRRLESVLWHLLLGAALLIRSNRSKRREFTMHSFQEVASKCEGYVGGRSVPSLRISYPSSLIVNNSRSS